jgi:hypothetical protein
MNVSELIAMLQRMPQQAQVVLGDPTASSDGCVYALRADEVQHLELGPRWSQHRRRDELQKSVSACARLAQAGELRFFGLRR